jgi:hypothetical protein
MRLDTNTALIVALSATTASATAATGTERWSATSSTAMAITGDISLSPTRLVMAGGRVLSLTVDSDTKRFTTPTGNQAARLLRVTRPANPTLLNGNTLCGAPVRWIAVYRSNHGRDLNLAAFSGAARPTGEAGPGLCGTFLYSR